MKLAGERFICRMPPKLKSIPPFTEVRFSSETLFTLATEGRAVCNLRRADTFSCPNTLFDKRGTRGNKGEYTHWVSAPSASSQQWPGAPVQELTGENKNPSQLETPNCSVTGYRPLHSVDIRSVASFIDLITTRPYGTDLFLV